MAINNEQVKMTASQKPEQGETEKIAIARDLIGNELGLSGQDGPADREAKIDAALSNPSFLEKIRNNDFLRRAFKVMVTAFVLLRAEPMLADQAPGNKTEAVQEKDWFATNKKLIAADEKVVPEKVMIAFGQTTDPNMLGVPAGGFFKKDFLENGDRRSEFRSRLSKLGYSDEEIAEFTSAFQPGSIVFNETALKKGDFREILIHERLHRAIYGLPAEEKRQLDEARDRVLEDYRRKEAIWSEKQDQLYPQLQSGKISQEEYQAATAAEMVKQGPILLDSQQGTGGLIPVLMNPEEFYTYLAMDKFQPAVKDYLISNFSEAYGIFIELQERIKADILEREVKY